MIDEAIVDNSDNVDRELAEKRMKEQSSFLLNSGKYGEL